MPQSGPGFFELVETARFQAVHLEMRDVYGVGNESEDFASWKRTGECDTDPASERWARWVELVRRTVGRGVAMRRARIVSEPVTDYIKYEHAITEVNVHAGEQVRWLPRRLASDLALPGNDLWLFDRTTVLFNHFTGDGEWADPQWEVRRETAVVDLVSTAFEAVWQRAFPHEKYTIRYGDARVSAHGRLPLIQRPSRPRSPRGTPA